MSCDDCERFIHNEDGSRVEKGRYPLRVAVPRPAGMLTPCYRCPKIPLDAPEKNRWFAVELSERNRVALQHYLECDAVGRFPDDPTGIVQQNARIINAVQASIKQGREQQQQAEFFALFMGIASRR